MELSKHLLHDHWKEEMGNATLLVYANKQDQYKALSVDDVINGLELDRLKTEYIVQPCCAVNGHGLREGLSKFDKMIRNI